MVVGRKCSVENLFEEVVLASYVCAACSKGWLMASHLWPRRVSSRSRAAQRRLVIIIEASVFYMKVSISLPSA